MGKELNPYEQGAADYESGKPNCNPFEEFSEKWAMYNRGYNKGWMTLSAAGAARGLPRNWLS